MAEKVEIDIVVKNQEAIKRFNALRETGEKVAQLGMRFSALFTLPIAGLAALVLKNEEVQKSLEPIKKAFGDISSTLAEAFIPVIKDLTPAILGIADAIKDVVAWFSNLDEGTKELIIKIALFGAALGPVIALVGNLMGTIGLMGELLVKMGPLFIETAVKSMGDGWPGRCSGGCRLCADYPIPNG